MQKFTLNLKKCVLFLLAVVFLSLSAFVICEDGMKTIHTILNKYYDKEGQQAQLKRYELNVTNNGFCRYRKVFTNGKEEFFAFNLTRFKSLDYYGNSENGELWLRTKSDDVIVQTRNDKSGDIDSMATYVMIPLKNIDVDQLNELASRLRKLTQPELAMNK